MYSVCYFTKSEIQNKRSSYVLLVELVPHLAAAVQFHSFTGTKFHAPAYVCTFQIVRALYCTRKNIK